MPQQAHRPSLQPRSVLTRLIPLPLLSLALGLGAPSLAAEHTVCLSGCDFVSPAACAIGDVNGDGVGGDDIGGDKDVSDGDLCLVDPGVYHETVSYATGFLHSNLEFICLGDATNPCVLDGDDALSHAFVGYQGWIIDGFEIRNYMDHAITAYGNNAVLRNCWIHDVAGRGVEKTNSVIENNLIQATGDSGILCPSSTAQLSVHNNVVVNVAIFSGVGISCALDHAQVEHNTVLIADNTQPFGAAAYGILGRVVRYNIVEGGNTSIYTSGTGALTAYNLVSGWASAGYGGTGNSTGDLSGDPLFFSREDLALQPSSPAIDAALTSTESVDFAAQPRSGIPDIGAFEFDPSHILQTGPWPIREQVSATPTLAAAPSLLMVPGQGPVMLSFNNRAGACDLVYSERRDDGIWDQETIKLNAQMQDYNNTDWSLHPSDLALDPETGRPAAVWVEQAGGLRYLRFARFLGKGCPTGDCSSARWQGCGDAPILYQGDHTLSVALAFHPTEHYPAVAASYVASNGLYRIYYWDRSDGNSWRIATVAQNLTSNYFLGQGVDISFNPVTGSAEIAFARIPKSPSNATGEIVVASGDLDGFNLVNVPIGSALPAASGVSNAVSMAHWPNGDLAVAYSARQSNNQGAIAYIERSNGAWGSMAATALGHHNNVGTNYRGMDLVIDSEGFSALAASMSNIVQLSRFDGSDWQRSAVDLRRETGDWVDLELGDNDELLLCYQRNTNGRAIEFAATADPGGLDPLASTSCDDQGPCLTGQCDADLGCIQTPKNCDDGNACTIDSCDRTTGCTNEPVSCDDGDACTTDSCDPVTGCTNEPVSCDDGDACNGVETCDGTGQCQPGLALPPCPLGTFGPCDNSIPDPQWTCTLCPVGTFNDQQGQDDVSSCTPCPVGNFANFPGSDRCSPCPSGAFAEAGSALCTECPVNTYSAADQGSCVACPEGTEALAGSSSVDACGIRVQAPSAPLNLRVTTVNDISVFLSWDPPASDGGSPIVNYPITLVALDSGTPRTLQSNAPALWILDLQPSSLYQVQVRAMNSASVGPQAELQFSTLASGPEILSWVAADPDNGDALYSAGDTMTLSFDQDTNQVPVASMAEINALLQFSSLIAEDYSGQWLDPATLQITVVSPLTAPSAIPAIASHIVRVKPGANLRNAAEDSAPSDSTSPALSGNWGTYSAELSLNQSTDMAEGDEDSWINLPQVSVNSNAELVQIDLATLSPDTASGTFAQGGVSGSSLHFEGSPSEVNTALADLRFLPAAQYNGELIIQTTASVANLGPQQVSTVLRVAAVNDPPSIDAPAKLTVPFDAYEYFAPASGVQIHDVDIESGLGVFSDRIRVRFISNDDVFGDSNGDLLRFVGAPVDGLDYNPTHGSAATSQDLTGPLASVNAALTALELQANASASSHHLQVLVSDMYNGGEPALNASTTVPVQIEPSPSDLVAVIANGRSATINEGRPYTLDGRGSYDPDHAFPINPSYTWTCTLDAGPCPILFEEAAVVNIPAGQLIPGDWRFTLTFASLGRSAQASHLLTVVPVAEVVNDEDPSLACNAAGAAQSNIWLLLGLSLVMLRRVRRRQAYS